MVQNVGFIDDFRHIQTAGFLQLVRGTVPETMMTGRVASRERISRNTSIPLMLGKRISRMMASGRSLSRYPRAASPVCLIVEPARASWVTCFPPMHRVVIYSPDTVQKMWIIAVISSTLPASGGGASVSSRPETVTH